jgi:hypothetical protein
MTYPDLLHPTDTEPVVLAPQTHVAVPKCTPQFARWRGAPLADTYRGKLLLDFQGRPAFAELVILWTLMAAGWQGVWNDTFGHCSRQGYWESPRLKTPPQPAHDLLQTIRARAGTRGGAWDVVCWRDEAILFAEAKQQGKDRFQATQIRWLGAALACGLPLDAFLIVEWSVEA